MRRSAADYHRVIGSGRFWQRFWLFWICVWTCAIWPAVTIWSTSIRWLNFVSVAALILGCAAAWQSSLTMRKADPDDPL